MNFTKNITKIALVGAFFVPIFASAQIQITEIMYNPPKTGYEKGWEWIEIMNDREQAVDLTEWEILKDNKGNYFTLEVSQGNKMVSPNGFAIITFNLDYFLEDWSFSGSIFKGDFYLSNTGEIIILKNNEGETINEEYVPDSEANGTGNSLQKTNSGWIASTPTPGTSNLTTENSGGSDSETQETPPDDSPPLVEMTTNTITVPKQSIFPDAGKDRVVTVGADTLFEGKAYGLKGELLENANYIWNFGDGTIKKGKKVMHSYSYPGEYVVFFDTSSGVYSNSDRISVTALPADLIISNIKIGMDGFIELHNKTERELDLSWWRLNVDNVFFTIPKNTFILSNNKIIFSSSNTGLIAKNWEVKLLYPNGSVANEYKRDIPIENSKIFESSESSSSSYVSIEPKKINSETKLETATSSQLTASVINSISNNEEEGGSIYKWLLAISAIILVAVVSVVFKKPKSNDDLSTESDEIEII